MANFSFQEDFSSVLWNKTLSDINADAIVAPDGTTTGDRLNSTASGISYATQVHTLDATGANCINIFAKEDDSGYGLMIATFNYTPTNSLSWFDLVNGTTGTKGAGHDSISMELINGWWRCTVVLTTTDLVGNVRFNVVDNDNDSSTEIGPSIYIWGAYSNTGSSPTPYVSEAGITVSSSSPKLIRNVTRNVTRDITKNLIDF